MGFCFVNNVAVAAAHAHLEHGIDRVVIIDIDLHHGNGTQEIAWRINSAANAAVNRRRARSSSPRKEGSPSKGKAPERDLSIMYASLHDIFSYPCEDGDPALVQAASINLSGGHSQYIANVHLESWSEEAEFHEKLYHKYRDGLLGAAVNFCEKTAIEEDESARTLVILSAGFDASEHESAGMSRHRRNVPSSFYHRFARDVVKFANQQAAGKVLAVLEGGYSDRALCSGTLATLIGLTEAPRFLEKTFLIEEGDEKRWWDEANLAKLEKACKIGRGGKLGGVGVGAEGGEEGWLRRTVELFQRIAGGEELEGAVKKEKEPDKPPQKTMQLRERRPRGNTDETPQGTPSISRLASVKAPGNKSTKLTGNPFVASLPPTVTIPKPPLPTTVEKANLTTGPAAAPLPDPTVAQPKIKFIWKEGGIGGAPRG
ncbi:histone deacetylase HOS3, partial [Phenoliferia sp. Uapishka_3]